MVQSRYFAPLEYGTGVVFSFSFMDGILNLVFTQINILAARTVASLLKTSLGPKGMDKMLVSPDGEVIITNDGATILEKMEVSTT